LPRTLLTSSSSRLGTEGNGLDHQGEHSKAGVPNATSGWGLAKPRWDAETRRKLAARQYSAMGERPADWTEHDDRAWLELKALETASGKTSPSEQQKADREQCISRFNGAASNEDRRKILRDFSEQYVDSAIVWPWFQERRDAFAQMGLPLYDRQPSNVEAAAQPSAVLATPKAFDGLGQKKIELSEYLDGAKLTERQGECASMKYEYDLPVAEIARRLGVHHSTIQESLAAANKRLGRNEKFKQALKKRAARLGTHDESD